LLLRQTEDRPKGCVVSVHECDRQTALGRLARFRGQFHGCLTARADALFDLADAVLCTDGPVRSLVGLSLAPEHRRGHGALYDAIRCGPVARPLVGSPGRAARRADRAAAGRASGGDLA
jgi:hypothetical protein